MARWYSYASGGGVVMLTTFPLETYEQRVRRKLDDLISRVFGAPFGRVLAPPFGPRLAAAGGDLAWYDLLTNGLAAFQPLGAASYAASKSNLLNPGTNDAVDGTAYPTWDASYGWDLAIGDYLTVGSGALVTSVPLTIVCLFQADDVTAFRPVAGIRQTGAANEGWLLSLHGNLGGDPIRASSFEGGVQSGATSTSGFTASTWYTAIGVFSANDARAVYLNGGSKGTDGNSSTPSTSVDATYIGANDNAGGISAIFDGKIGAIGFAEATHSDAEVLAISNAALALVS